MTKDIQNNPASGLHPPQVISAPASEYRVASRKWQGIPGIEIASNGRRWATWYTGEDREGPGNFVVLATSGDDGLTWIDPVLCVVPGLKRRSFDPCLWHGPKGRLWLFWAQVGDNEHYDGRAGVWAIRTDDATIETPVWTAPMRLCHGIMMNKPTVLANGEWLLPVSVWCEHPTHQPKDDVFAHRGTGVVASEDEGETWNWRGGLVTLPCKTYDEHMLVERQDESIWMLIRTKYGIAESRSNDGGRTWCRASPTELEHPDSRFFICRLQSGALLLVKHHGFGDPCGLADRSHLTALLSDDEGRTWSKKGLLLDKRIGVSYPDGKQTPDGKIHIIYDFNRGDPPAKGDDREILIATFTEEDIRAEKCVSSDSRLKQIVSKIPKGINLMVKELPS